ncbi:MAG TPA: FYDLN acid domain-containing protein, partial [Rhizomicrobium sp.]
SKDLYRRGNRWQTRPSNNPFFTGSIILVKADLGTKRQCPSCASRFYDLTKRPIECPKCGFSYEPEALFKQRRSRVAEPAAGVVPAKEADDEEEDDEDEDDESADDEEDEEVETVVEAPLKIAATGEDEDEDAEEEEAEAESGMSVVDADEADGIEDIEVEDDEDDEDNDLLGEVEDEEDDVSGIIDPGISKDES